MYISRSYPDSTPVTLKISNSENNFCFNPLPDDLDIYSLKAKVSTFDEFQGITEGKTNTAKKIVILSPNPTRGIIKESSKKNKNLGINHIFIYIS